MSGLLKEKFLAHYGIASSRRAAGRELLQADALFLGPMV